ncbi:Hypothetical protein NTJ_08021 [Nesidiocoris tenuis]|uniref:Uncharacterized protein n=1 Tax=Nesidiocoris tenuis TaxID=355587 RepID=A0ABN7AXK4_9HEMI|nr:Hypothetical protein NTJ_08021 [Nesidiocoris tenuis]
MARRISRSSASQNHLCWNGIGRGIDCERGKLTGRSSRGRGSASGSSEFQAGLKKAEGDCCGEICIIPDKSPSAPGRRVERKTGK